MNARYMFQPDDPNDPSMVIDADSFDEALTKANLGLTDSEMMLIECSDEEETVQAIQTELRQSRDGKMRHAAVDVRSLKLVRVVRAD